MFLGHFAAGLAGKSVAPRLSLGTLFLGAQFVDLLWPTLLLVGLEHVEIEPGATAFTPLAFTHYPYSHSLLMAVIWGAVIGGIYWLTRRHARAALVLAAAVVSHWVLDLVVHRPDLPLAFGENVLVGFGLWNSIPGTLLLEALLFVAGLIIYVRITEARDRIGSIAFWSLIGFLVLIYLMNSFGPPPPDTASIAWVGQAQWLLVAWAYWADSHRLTRRRPS